MSQQDPFTENRIGRVEELEKALQESEERYRLLTSEMEDVITLSTLDRKSAYISPSFYRLTGYTHADIISSDFSARVHPEDLPKVEQTREANLRGEQTRLEWRCLCKDSTYLWLETTAKPIADEDGKVVRIACCTRNITERKRAEETLRQSEERYRLLVEIMADVVSLHDKEGKVVFVTASARRLTGYTEPELIGQSFLPLAHPHDEDVVQNSWEQCVTGQTVRLEWRCRCKGGTCLWVETECNPRLDEHGQVIQVVCCTRNINERKRIEEENQEFQKRLEHTQKWESLGVLAAGVAHDFNNLLTTVLGYASMAKTTVGASSPLVFMLEQIMESGQRAANLTQKILAYAGKSRYRSLPISLSAAIESQRNDLKVLVNKQARLRFLLEEDLLLIEADPDQIREIVRNLVTNALEALETEGETITLRTGQIDLRDPAGYSPFAAPGLSPGWFVYLQVDDTGCGMSDEMIGKIFDPFFTTKFLGRGLGLASVLGIVKGHRGIIKVESKESLGSSFQVLFPAQARLFSEKRDIEQSQTWAPSRGTILLIEEEGGTRSLISHSLLRAGYQVQEMSNIQEGQPLFQQGSEKIPLILLGISPSKNQTDSLLSYLYQIPSEIKIVLMSDCSPKEVETFLGPVPFFAVLQKPFTHENLLKTIRRAFSSGIPSSINGSNYNP